MMKFILTLINYPSLHTLPIPRPALRLAGLLRTLPELGAKGPSLGTLHRAAIFCEKSVFVTITEYNYVTVT